MISAQAATAHVVDSWIWFMVRLTARIVVAGIGCGSAPGRD
jgi:hypothetical protein